MPTSKNVFLKKLCFPLEKQWFWRFRGSKLEVKFDEKSIKKGGQDGKAYWHRFLMDFGGFLEASWEGKWSQDRSKKASKRRWINGRHQDGQKIEKKTLRDAQDTPRISPKTAQDASQDGPSGSTWHSTSPLFGRWISKSHSTSHSTSGPQAVTPLKRGDRVI